MTNALADVAAAASALFVTVVLATEAVATTGRIERIPPAFRELLPNDDHVRSRAAAATGIVIALAVQSLTVYQLILRGEPTTAAKVSIPVELALAASWSLYLWRTPKDSSTSKEGPRAT